MPDYRKDFMDTIKSFHADERSVFDDFLVLMASVISMPAYAFRSKAEYMKVCDKYDESEVELFEVLYNITVNALEEKYCDFLGSIDLLLPAGQSSPIASKSTVDIDIEAVGELVKRGEILTFTESNYQNVISFCENLYKAGVDYSNFMYVRIIDADYNRYLMAYIQLSLYAVPALVMHGDNSRQHHERYTAIYFINDFNSKLRLKKITEITQGKKSVAPKKDSVVSLNQMELGL